MSGDSLGYIAALDVGTTTVRCQIFDRQPRCVGSSFNSVHLHYPSLGSVEINPDELWNCIISVVKNAVQDADISMRQVRSLAISVQRATFITWRKNNGQPLHNFITWKDLRATELIENINKSWKMTTLRTGAYLLHLLSRQVKFGIVSKFKFASSHVTLRLLWMLQNHVEVQQALLEDNLMFGTLDTWLVYRLTAGQTYVTDITSASGTGLYDPFKLCWSFIPGFFNIPTKILPPVVDNDFQFGSTSENVFGVPIRIGVVMADQSASLYSCHGDLKLTLGTGAFLNLSTGRRIPGGNVRGMYPLVGWKSKQELMYMVEVPCLDAGSLVQWMISTDLISCPGELNSLDQSPVKGNGGVYFVSAFSGLGPPINNETAGSGFIGIKPTTKKEHLIRAVLESIVYRTALAYRLVEKEFRKMVPGYIRWPKMTQLHTRPCGYRNKKIAVDGGVAKNNYICQLLADLANVVVHRANVEMATLGVTYLAGLSCGFWQNREETTNLETDDDIFQPSEVAARIKEVEANFENWKKAAKRFTSWYDDLAEASCEPVD